MEHQAQVLKMPAQVSLDTLDNIEDGTYVLQFDGGTVQKCGVGGVLVWGLSGQLLMAQALWFGDERSTNNESELGALLWGLQWAETAGLPSGEWMVIGDSNLVLGYCTRRFKPQQKFLPDVQKIREIVRKLPGKV